MGDGIIKIEMHFLPDVLFLVRSAMDVVTIVRPSKSTTRKNIAEVLDIMVNKAVESLQAIFRNAKLKTIPRWACYVTLGQPATTLSGGEAKRMKLV